MRITRVSLILAGLALGLAFGAPQISAASGANAQTALLLDILAGQNDPVPSEILAEIETNERSHAGTVDKEGSFVEVEQYGDYHDLEDQVMENLQGENQESSAPEATVETPATPETPTVEAPSVEAPSAGHPEPATTAGE